MEKIDLGFFSKVVLWNTSYVTVHRKALYAVCNPLEVNSSNRQHRFRNESNPCERRLDKFLYLNWQGIISSWSEICLSTKDVYVAAYECILLRLLDTQKEKKNHLKRCTKIILAYKVVRSENTSQVMYNGLLSWWHLNSRYKLGDKSKQQV